MKWVNWNALLTRVPLILTFDLHLWPWIFKVKLYLGNGCPDCHGTKGTGVNMMPWCETLRKWVNWTLRWLGVPLTLIFDLQFARSNCISGMGGLLIMERKRRESKGCPDVKHWGNESTGRCPDRGTFDLCLWSSIFKVKLYLGNGRPDYHGMKGMGVNRMPWCKRQPLCDLEAEETVRDRGDLRRQRFRRLILVHNSNEILRCYFVGPCDKDLILWCVKLSLPYESAYTVKDP